MISNTNIRSTAWNNLKQDIGIAVGAIILFFIVSIAMSSLPFIGFILQIVFTGALYVGYCFKRGLGNFFNKVFNIRFFTKNYCNVRNNSHI